jgi:hypothetical protein
LATGLPAVASLEGGGLGAEGNGGLDQHLIDGFGPDFAELLGILAALTTTSDTERAWIR